MGKKTDDSVMDAALAVISGGSSLVQHVCAGEPTDRADAIAKSLADVALVGGDFTLANGDVSGRKHTVAQKSAVPIDATGTADHVAIVDGTTLLDVTTCTSQALTSGGTVTIPAWKHEIQDPS